MRIKKDEPIQIYEDSYAKLRNLSGQAFKVLCFIFCVLQPERDKFYFLLADCMKATGYTSKSTIYIALAELIEAKMIAKGKSDTAYFINPRLFFKGNRGSYLQRRSFNHQRL